MTIQRVQPQRVLTIKDDPPSRTQVVNISQMNEHDFKSLQQDDPFLFHSIPAVYEARIHDRKVDYSKIKTSVASASSNNASSSPSSSPQGSSSPIVTRRSRMSTECHMNMIIEAVLAGGADEDFMADFD